MAFVELVDLKGVGNNTLEKLKRLNIHSLKDLLFHLPSRYVDKTKVVAIEATMPNEYATIEAQVVSTSQTRGNKKYFQVIVADATENLTLVFFNFSPFLAKKFIKDKIVRCFGQVRVFAKKRQIIHPECEFIDNSETESNSQLSPIYPVTQGLTQRQLRNITKTALDTIKNKPPFNLPEEVLPAKLNMTLYQALQVLHFPEATEDSKIVDIARKRLAFEELLTHHLRMQVNKIIQNKETAWRITTKHKLEDKLRNNLPFKLTNAQNKVLREISSDMCHDVPMLRLVQGDVGCGKTLVAAISALSIIENNLQVALMAPTEILAQQHYINFEKWFLPLGLKVALFTQGNSKEQKQILEDMEAGAINIVIGTHALIQPTVNFFRLGLVIIDEQHRFGVQQRGILHKKSKDSDNVPHHLVLSATPIPRTMALTFYANLDYSNIDELPSGRKQITTLAVPIRKKLEVVEKIRRTCMKGEQVYWVCTLINESEHIDSTPAEETIDHIKQNLPEIKAELVHGKMKASEKKDIMQRFKTGITKILVATTVIEVGVDVPAATLMVIENPERLGLAQLHQLRGRVGRAAIASYCILLYGVALSQFAKSRIDTLRKYDDGFKIAEEDLKLRGPGEILGTRQSGDITLKVASFIEDSDLFQHLPQAAAIVLEKYKDIPKILFSRWLPSNSMLA